MQFSWTSWERWTKWELFEGSSSWIWICSYIWR